MIKLVTAQDTHIPGCDMDPSLESYAKNDFSNNVSSYLYPSQIEELTGITNDPTTFNYIVQRAYPVFTLNLSEDDAFNATCKKAMEIFGGEYYPAMVESTEYDEVTQKYTVKFNNKKGIRYKAVELGVGITYNRTDYPKGDPDSYNPTLRSQEPYDYTLANTKLIYYPFRVDIFEPENNGGNDTNMGNKFPMLETHLLAHSSMDRSGDKRKYSLLEYDLAAMGIDPNQVDTTVDIPTDVDNTSVRLVLNDNNVFYRRHENKKYSISKTSIEGHNHIKGYFIPTLEQYFNPIVEKKAQNMILPMLSNNVKARIEGNQERTIGQLIAVDLDNFIEKPNDVNFTDLTFFIQKFASEQSEDYSFLDGHRDLGLDITDSYDEYTYKKYYDHGKRHLFDEIIHKLTILFGKSFANYWERDPNNTPAVKIRVTDVEIDDEPPTATPYPTLLPYKDANLEYDSNLYEIGNLEPNGPVYMYKKLTVTLEMDDDVNIEELTKSTSKKVTVWMAVPTLDVYFFLSTVFASSRYEAPSYDESMADYVFDGIKPSSGYPHRDLLDGDEPYTTEDHNAEEARKYIYWNQMSNVQMSIPDGNFASEEYYKSSEENPYSMLAWIFEPDEEYVTNFVAYMCGIRKSILRTELVDSEKKLFRVSMVEKHKIIGQSDLWIRFKGMENGEHYLESLGARGRDLHDDNIYSGPVQSYGKTYDKDRLIELNSLRKVLLHVSNYYQPRTAKHFDSLVHDQYRNCFSKSYETHLMKVKEADGGNTSYYEIESYFPVGTTLRYPFELPMTCYSYFTSDFLESCVEPWQIFDEEGNNVYLSTKGHAPYIGNISADLYFDNPCAYLNNSRISKVFLDRDYDDGSDHKFNTGYFYLEESEVYVFPPNGRRKRWTYPLIDSRVRGEVRSDDINVFVGRDIVSENEPDGTIIHMNIVTGEFRKGHIDDEDFIPLGWQAIKTYWSDTYEEDPSREDHAYGQLDQHRAREIKDMFFRPFMPRVCKKYNTLSKEQSDEYYVVVDIVNHTEKVKSLRAEVNGSSVMTEEEANQFLETYKPIYHRDTDTVAWVQK